MIAVIGGGLIGACAAFELNQAGHEVVVFDADLPGAAWRAGAGLLSPSGERLQGTPLESDANDSLHLWPDFARRLEAVSGQSVGFQRGVYRVAFDDSQARALKGDGEGDAVTAPPAYHAANQNPSSSQIGSGNPEQHQNKQSACSGAQFSAVRFHPNEGRVHPPSVRSAALSDLRLERAHIAKIEPLERGVRLHTGEGIFEARATLLCCGAWSQTFGLSVRAVQGQALLLDGPRDTPALYGPPQIGSSQYALGRPDGLYVGATSRDTDTSETNPDTAALSALREKAQRLLGQEEAHAPLLQHLVGFRPTTPDGLPLIGRHPTLPHVIVATGHSRHGVLLAPLTAQCVVQLIRELLAEAGAPTREAALYGAALS